MKIAEVRKIMAAQPTGFRVSYITKADLDGPSQVTQAHFAPEIDEPPLTQEEACEISTAFNAGGKFKPYGIVRAWVVEA